MKTLIIMLLLTISCFATPTDYIVYRTGYNGNNEIINCRFNVPVYVKLVATEDMWDENQLRNKLNEKTIHVIHCPAGSHNFKTNGGYYMMKIVPVNYKLAKQTLINKLVDKLFDKSANKLIVSLDKIIPIV